MKTEETKTINTIKRGTAKPLYLCGMLDLGTDHDVFFRSEFEITLGLRSGR
jgi:hypothetical protein